MLTQRPASVQLHTNSLSPFSAQQGARLQRYKGNSWTPWGFAVNGIIHTYQEPSHGLGINLLTDRWSHGRVELLRVLEAVRMQPDRHRPAGVWSRVMNRQHTSPQTVVREWRAAKWAWFIATSHFLCASYQGRWTPCLDGSVLTCACKQRVNVGSRSAGVDLPCRKLWGQGQSVSVLTVPPDDSDAKVSELLEYLNNFPSKLLMPGEGCYKSTYFYLLWPHHCRHSFFGRKLFFFFPQEDEC